MKTSRLILLTLFIALFILLITSIYSTKNKNTSTVLKPTPTVITPTITTIPTIISYEKAFVVRVIDGDTIEIENKKRVRYTGINAPETKDPRKGVECFGREASKKNKELVEGKTIYLEKDVSETDKFGRLLRYVYLDNPAVNKNAVFVNEYLVKEGYAQVSTFPPDIKYIDLFLQAQKEAQKNNKGLWRNCRL